MATKQLLLYNASEMKRILERNLSGHEGGNWSLCPVVDVGHGTACFLKVSSEKLVPRVEWLNNENRFMPSFLGKERDFRSDDDDVGSSTSSAFSE